MFVICGLVIKELVEALSNCVMLQTQLLTKQFTQSMTEVTRETEAKTNLTRLAGFTDNF